jgi:excinuclease ABC subunit A
VPDAIVVKGAREHNLKDIDVDIPREKLVVITGLSGSGKSSLAFDTVYAEGQRRYVESLSAYARQFLGLMEKPDVDYIEGLSPAISIDQKGDYLRLLYARAGTPHCPNCDRVIERQTVQQIVDDILEWPEGAKLLLLAPVIKDRKGEHQGVFADARRLGFVRVRVDGQIRSVEDDIKLDKKRKHSIEVVIDRLVATGAGKHVGAQHATPGDGAAEERQRVTDSAEQALKLGGGVMVVSAEDGEERIFSEHFACPFCGISLGEIEPRTFSFNSPHGACPDCTGLGRKLRVDPELVIPNRMLSLSQGAIAPWARAASVSTWYFKMLEAVAERYDIPMDTPVRELKPEHLQIVLYGTDGKVRLRFTNSQGRSHYYDSTYEGIINNLERRFRETDSDYIKTEIERYMASVPCDTCKGQRLKPEALAVKVDGRSITEVARLSISEADEWVARLQGEKTPLNQREQIIARQILKEIRSRLKFMIDVGIEYLSLDRGAATLSGGESQRIRLATQIGSSLTGVLYVCDEPSIGLHPIDNHRLILTLERLRDLGNTVMVVEHDEAMMRAADHIIDMGPGAGENGGHVVAAGKIAAIKKSQESITGAYLDGRREIPQPALRRPGSGKVVTIRGARENNLKNVDVDVPLGKFVCVTGVSGSGKSSLINEILYKKAAQLLYGARDRPGDCDGIEGLQNVDKVVDIDQSPIGRTPRSNPATYTGAFTPIRELFASVPEARARGYGPGRFSFNVKGGRCEACSGDGYIEIEMQFLPDVTVPCEVCHGARYNREALEIHFKGASIADVLNMTVHQATEFFSAFPKVRNKLATMEDVGLGYIRLGQPATTISGGEAQRVKLATELSRRATGKTLYILDEPTTGLSFEDVKALLEVLQRLVDSSNTVVVIEHHLDVIKCADHIIDLGPAGGAAGGRVIAEGTPEQVAKVKSSATGGFLKDILKPLDEKTAKRPNGRNGRVADQESVGQLRAARRATARAG